MRPPRSTPRRTRRWRTRIARIEALLRRATACRRASAPPRSTPPGWRRCWPRAAMSRRTRRSSCWRRSAPSPRPIPPPTALPAPDADWMAVTATAEHQTPARRREKEGTPALLMVPGAWITLHEAGAAAAVISVVAAGPVAGFFDLAVPPDASPARPGRAGGARGGPLGAGAGRAMAVLPGGRGQCGVARAQHRARHGRGLSLPVLGARAGCGAGLALRLKAPGRRLARRASYRLR